MTGTCRVTTSTVLATKTAADHTGEACNRHQDQGERDLGDVEAEHVDHVGGEQRAASSGAGRFDPSSSSAGAVTVTAGRRTDRVRAAATRYASPVTAASPRSAVVPPARHAVAIGAPAPTGGRCAGHGLPRARRRGRQAVGDRGHERRVEQAGQAWLPMPRKSAAAKNRAGVAGDGHATAGGALPSGYGCGCCAPWPAARTPPASWPTPGNSPPPRSPATSPSCAARACSRPDGTAATSTTPWTCPASRLWAPTCWRPYCADRRPPTDVPVPRRPDGIRPVRCAAKHRYDFRHAHQPIG
ncbi:hypothetical protein SGLAM104S_08722 [Streptomyces glaucescens]